MAAAPSARHAHRTHVEFYYIFLIAIAINYVSIGSTIGFIEPFH